MDLIAKLLTLLRGEILNLINTVKFGNEKLSAEIKNQKSPTINVQPPIVHVAPPKVEVNVPDVHVPKIEIPDIQIPKIEVPAPQVTVNPKIDIPPFPKEIEVKGFQTLLQAIKDWTPGKPFPVTIIGEDGKPLKSFPGGSPSNDAWKTASGGARGNRVIFGPGATDFRSVNIAGQQINPATEDSLAAIKAILANLTFTGNALNVTGGGGGGGASTIADGADVNAGATTDAAITSDTNGTLSAKLRGLVKILASVWDSINGRLKVDGSGVTQPVSGSVSVSNFLLHNPSPLPRFHFQREQQQAQSKILETAVLETSTPTQEHRPMLL